MAAVDVARWGEDPEWVGYAEAETVKRLRQALALEREHRRLPANERPPRLVLTLDAAPPPPPRITLHRDNIRV